MLSDAERLDLGEHTLDFPEGFGWEWAYNGTYLDRQKAGREAWYILAEEPQWAEHFG